MWFVSSLTLLLSLLITQEVSAQWIDPYRRVTDPRAIAELKCDDCQPLKFRGRFRLPPEKDEFDQHILAQDSGAGIITHFWATADLVDSLTDLRVYIDGKLIIKSTFRDFFLKPTGMLRPPLDTALAGGWVSDVQMPYRTGFKITYSSPSYNVYYAIKWRSIDDPSKVKSFALFPSASDASYQVAAERRLLSEDSPWDPGSQETVLANVSLPQSARLTIADIKGPGMVQELECDPVIEDPWRFHNLYLRIYFDNNPHAAVDVPLYDFFLSATKYKKIGALSIKVRKDSSMVCYFPMPFASACRIELENRDTALAELSARVAYSQESIDRQKVGYFHAVFNESKPTRLGIYHPVVHVRGRGKFVGLSHHIPHLFFAVDLEGDPIFTVDSNPAHFVRYTGGEDYYNGGWWFLGVLYSRPFAGFHTWFDAFYRFHHLDAMDFNESFDFDMQHGVNNDVHEHYRTVGYYYKQWTPFWTSRDTVRTHEPLVIQGTGYAPSESIVISIGEFTVDSTVASATGEFQRRIYLPGRIAAGKYHVRVNSDEKPEWLYVISAPEVRAIADHLIPTLRERDTLIVTGTGFQPGEQVEIFLDSISLGHTFVTGSDHRFTGVVRMPYLPDRDYNLVAIGPLSGEAIARYPVRLTRTHNFEFEQMLPAANKTSENARRDNVSFFYHDKWSQQSFVYFEAAGRDSFITFAVDVPRTDTFNVFMFATQGRKFGDYEYSIDGKKLGEFSGFRSSNWYDPWRSDTLHCGSLFLEEGIHLVTFKCLGKSDSAEQAWLGADNIILKPTNQLPPAPGTWTGSVRVEHRFGDRQLVVYPNPASMTINVSWLLSEQDADIMHETAFLNIFDIAGKVLASKTIAPQSFLDSPIELDISTLASGSYFISLSLTGSTRTVVLTSPLKISR